MQGVKSSSFATKAVIRNRIFVWSLLQRKRISNTGIWIGYRTIAWYSVHFAMNVLFESFLIRNISESSSRNLVASTCVGWVTNLIITSWIICTFFCINVAHTGQVIGYMVVVTDLCRIRSLHFLWCCQHSRIHHN